MNLIIMPEEQNMCEGDREAVFLGECKEAATISQSWKEAEAGWLCKRHMLADPLSALTPVLSA